MNLYTVRFFAKAIKYGSKYVYQTVPRLLTIWLDMGEDQRFQTGDVFKKLNDAVAKAIKETPVYKVSRSAILKHGLMHDISGIPPSPK
jgi:serine/threonine-protein kinase ATR